MVDGQQTVNNQDSTDTAGQSAAAAQAIFDRDHPVFKKVTAELAATRQKLDEIERSKSEESKKLAIQAEAEKGNYSAALEKAEQLKAQEIGALKSQYESAVKQIETERATNKLLAAGVSNLKAAAFLAREFDALPVEDKPAFDAWVTKAKTDPDYEGFFGSKSAIQQPADRSGSGVARAANDGAKFKEILSAPGKFTIAEVREATKWRSNYIATHGHMP